jgi:hypothetical protein
MFGLWLVDKHRWATVYDVAYAKTRPRSLEAAVVYGSRDHAEQAREELVDDGVLPTRTDVQPMTDGQSGFVMLGVMLNGG